MFVYPPFYFILFFQYCWLCSGSARCLAYRVVIFFTHHWHQCARNIHSSTVCLISFMRWSVVSLFSSLFSIFYFSLLSGSFSVVDLRPDCLPFPFIPSPSPHVHLSIFYIPFLIVLFDIGRSYLLVRSLVSVLVLVLVFWLKIRMIPSRIVLTPHPFLSLVRRGSMRRNDF